MKACKGRFVIMSKVAQMFWLLVLVLPVLVMYSVAGSF